MNIESTETAVVDRHRRSRRRVAFISGHIDLPRQTFLLHYKDRLDAAIAAGDDFILSNASGADSLALQYLQSQNVSPSRVKIYIRTPPVERQKAAETNETIRHVDRRRPQQETMDQYGKQGFAVKVLDGSHTERDTVMTRESDYDILWIRSEEDTKALYGRKYRPGRVSGTQKNKDRREMQSRE